MHYLQSLNSRNVCGYDGQPPRLLKFNALLLNFTLLPILNNSIEHNVFPTDLKYAEVSLLHFDTFIMSLYTS